MGYGTTDTVLWTDRKRHFGMPLSFTVYEISEDRLFHTVGFLQRDYRQVPLYAIHDIKLTRSLGQIVAGVGTVTVTTNDNRRMVLQNIKSPVKVKELIHYRSEEEKQKRRYYYGGMNPYFQMKSELLGSRMALT